MRKEDPANYNPAFRAPDRYFQIDGRWYFAAREGDIGPFRTRAQAEREAAFYTQARQAKREEGGRRARQKDEQRAPGFAYRCILGAVPPARRPADLVLDPDAPK